MSYFKKIGQFFLTVLYFPFTLIVWWLSFGLFFAFGAGYFIFVRAMMEILELFQDGKSSLFLKPNPNYGAVDYYSYTDTIKNDILDEDGNKIGSYESQGATHSGYSEDDRKYVAKIPLIFVYFFFFPIFKIIALASSFFALFTSKFYVSVKAPNDYSDIKYNRTLHSLFNIVWERSKKGKARVLQKKHAKEQKKQEKQERKERIAREREERREANREKKQSQRKTADRILGIILKLLGLIGVVLIIYLIVK